MCYNVFVVHREIKNDFSAEKQKNRSVPKIILELAEEVVKITEATKILKLGLAKRREVIYHGINFSVSSNSTKI